MKCGHCSIEFHPIEEIFSLGDDDEGKWAMLKYVCPACKKANLWLVNGKITIKDDQPILIEEIHYKSQIRPRNSFRPKSPSELPESIAVDYLEACKVLDDSPKASAALSRRCLQNLLREAAGVGPSNLAEEIQEVLDAKSLPSYVSEAIDAIRNVGNFAAHPLKSQTTGQIIPVEPEEAEWNLNVLELLFDIYYIQPLLLAKKRTELNKKLAEAGKKSMK